ncbi:MAG: carbohydrate binding domain-containing protein [Fimbriimonadaceae bacterium]|nr:carbohydrate binding domain-containing protein [Fimbriimonadaceae bacterium]
MTSALMAACLLTARQEPTRLRPVSDSFFPFVMPWDDAPNGSAADVSFLNERPAGRNGRIVAKNGHFQEGTSGKRVRFFGTNVGAKAAFPSRADADKIAARMAKLGINIVRFHHLNNGWDLNGGTIWKPGKTHLEMDPAQLDKLDYFVAALKKQGIYSNINLQTSREYLPEMGLPESVRKVPNFGKKVDKYFERMIEIQQAYARDLLDRVNPHTGLKYADDPAVMVVEINNENSLVGWPGEAAGAGLNTMPDEFVADLRARWVAWLKRKYSDDAGLRRAWSARDEIVGASVVSRANRWTNENQSGGDVTFAEVPPAEGESSVGLDVTVNSNGGPNWHVQAHLGGLDLKPGQSYTLEFRAKADRAVGFGIDSRLDQPDWRFIGLSASATAGPEWRDYAFTFTARDTVPNHARIGLVLGDMRGKLQIRNVRLRPGVRYAGLAADQSLGMANIELPTQDGSPRFRDYTDFLADLETTYAKRMRTYLRDDLGFKLTNLIDSQIAWGGLTSIQRERDMEFTDNHAYWNHPTFLSGEWNSKSYRVDRRSLAHEMTGNNGTLWDLAVYRVAGKPYSVSEYNHPAPSDYQVEMMPMYATFGAYQDWDILYTFAWDATGTGETNDRYGNYFDMAKNPAKAAFFPAAALIFRNALVPAAGTVAMAGLGPKAHADHATAYDVWSEGGASLSVFQQRLELVPGAPRGIRYERSGNSRRPIAVVPAKHGRVYRVDAPGAKAFAGFVGESTVAMEDAQFTFGAFGFNFAAVTLTATDAMSIPRSKRVLLTVGARVENENMAWNDARDSVSDQWGTGPVRAEFVPMTVQIRTEGPRKVFALRPNGTRLAEVKTSVTGGMLTFPTGTSPSMWFEIVAP